MPSCHSSPGKLHQTPSVGTGLGVPGTSEHSKIAVLSCPVWTTAPFSNQVMKIKMPGDRNAESPVSGHHMQSRADREPGSVLKTRKKRQDTGEGRYPNRRLKYNTVKRYLGKEMIYWSDLSTHQRRHSPGTPSGASSLFQLPEAVAFVPSQVNPRCSPHPSEQILAQGALEHRLLGLITCSCILISSLAWQ